MTGLVCGANALYKLLFRFVAAMHVLEANAATLRVLGVRWRDGAERALRRGGAQDACLVEEERQEGEDEERVEANDEDCANERLPEWRLG